MWFWLIFSLTSPAATTAPLTPVGKWTVDYEPEMCIVSRSFGLDPDQVTFAIQPDTDIASTAASLLILAPESGSKQVEIGRAIITLQPSGVTRTVNYVSAMLPNKLRGFRMDADEELMTAAAEATGVTISPGKRTFALATGKIKPVIAALYNCNADLFKSWGIDPAARAKPVGNAGAWFDPSEYPVEVRRSGFEGRTVIAVTVGPDGRPIACKNVVPSKNKLLDSTTCDLAMRRGRFDTAPGKTDRFVILGVRWSMRAL